VIYIQHSNLLKPMNSTCTGTMPCDQETTVSLQILLEKASKLQPTIDPVSGTNIQNYNLFMWAKLSYHYLQSWQCLSPIIHLRSPWWDIMHIMYTSHYLVLKGHWRLWLPCWQLPSLNDCTGSNVIDNNLITEWNLHLWYFNMNTIDYKWIHWFTLPDLDG